jgi:signal transduction histidine kinase
MHSHGSDQTPDTDLPPARLRTESVLLAVFVALACILGGVGSAVVLARGLPDLGTPAALVACLGSVVTAALGVFVVERHRRVLTARIERYRELNQSLRQSGIRKDEFLASVSHELRTPLNVVLGYVDLLLDHSFGPLEPGQRDILHRITKNASNLSHLINDLVDLSRIEAGRMRIEMEIVDLEPLFADLTAVMEVLLAGHDVRFRADIAPGCDRLHADPDRLKQIVSNLLVNAVKFTERGTIALSADPAPDGQVVIAVADTGIGIPSSDHQAIFEPFRQVHDRERRAPGAGIGLSISSRLAVLMGGTLSVESAPGHGSRFSLVLEGPHPKAPPAAFTLRKVS